MTTTLGARYARAIEYATRMHAGQVRKGTTIDYVTHPIAVSALIVEAGGDEDLAIAGLLHDVPEDCGGEPRLVEIEEMFGPRVARIVRACSDSLTEDPEAKDDWLTRKRTHLAHLARADRDVLTVTAADKAHNAAALWADVQREGMQYLSRFNATPLQSAWYYSSLLRLLLAGPTPSRLVDFLAASVIPLTEAIQARQGRLDGRARAFRAVAGTFAAADAARHPTGRATAEQLVMTDVPASWALDAAGVDVNDDALADRFAASFGEPDTWQWSSQTVRQLQALLPGTGVDLWTAGQEWQLRVFTAIDVPLAVFDSSGTFRSAANWDARSWSGITEGGPPAVARSMVRGAAQYLAEGTKQDLPRRDLRERTPPA